MFAVPHVDGALMDISGPNLFANPGIFKLFQTSLWILWVRMHKMLNQVTLESLEPLLASEAV
jgi:hypothetical protein